MAELTTTDGHLNIFDNFQTYDGTGTGGWVTFDNSTTGVISGLTINGPTEVWTNGSTNIRTIFDKKFKDIITNTKNLFFNPRKFFKEMKKTLQINTEEKLKKQIKNFELLINQVKTTGQTALKEKLEEQSIRIKRELTLLSKGYNIFVSEEDIINFSKRSVKAVKLDWIKNYTRLIPQKVIKEIVKANKDKIFDNYVILHYDPKDENRADTKKEIEKKKDPILFGVVKESNRLYYIADWIDEYCNLTLVKLLDELNIKEEERKLSVSKILNTDYKETKVKEKKIKCTTDKEFSKKFGKTLENLNKRDNLKTKYKKKRK